MMPIKLDPPVYYATPSALADAYMPTLEEAWRCRPDFAVSVPIPIPDYLTLARPRFSSAVEDGAASDNLDRFLWQVSLRLPDGWSLRYDELIGAVKHHNIGASLVYGPALESILGDLSDQWV